jgi:hypothetical protein
MPVLGRNLAVYETHSLVDVASPDLTILSVYVVEVAER